MMQAGRPVLDHAVINVGTSLDEAEQRYRALGFRLLPRGHHTLGSSNHLAMFGENYLELLGVEPPKASLRPDLVAAPVGLNALVFKADDADAVQARLRARGAAETPVRRFSRPVQQDGQTLEARFRTIGLPDAPGVQGRSFFCEHQTPELVWLPGENVHPNGVQDIVGFILVGQRPAEVLDAYARWFDGVEVAEDAQGCLGFQAGRARVVCATPARLQAAYGLDVPCPADAVGAMAALHLRVTSVDDVAALLSGADVPHHRHGGHLVVPPAQACGVGLVFSA